MIAKIITDKFMQTQFCMDYMVSSIDVLPTMDGSYKVVGGHYMKDLDGAEYLIPEVVLTEQEYVSWESSYTPDSTTLHYYEVVQPEAFSLDELYKRLWHFTLRLTWETCGMSRFSNYDIDMLTTRLQCEQFQYDPHTDRIALLDYVDITDDGYGHHLIELSPIGYLSLEDFEKEVDILEEYNEWCLNHCVTVFDE